MSVDADAVCLSQVSAAGTLDRAKDVTVGTFTFALLRACVGVAVISGLVIVVSDDAWAQTSKFEKGDFIGMVALFTVLVIIPSVLFFWLTGRRFGRLANASRGWPTVQGKVLASAVQEKQGRAGSGADTRYYTIFAPVVQYDYEVAGVLFENGTVQFGQLEMRQGKAEAVVKQYPMGAAVTVHYDPGNPKTATLETSSDAAKLRYLVVWALLGLTVLVYIGLAVIIRMM